MDKAGTVSKALIAMSGGVDSSVAAVLMKNAGYDCIGCTMKLRRHKDIGIPDSACCSIDDAEDAKSVAYKLGMKYYVFNFSEEFRSQIIGRFISGYENGETPNPCIDCNTYMKFGKLLDRAEELGCDYVATGHYARVVPDERTGRPLLKKSLNRLKDQSYVLYTLSPEQLAHVRFPLGEFTDKEQVRAIAAEYGFITADKKDSQDICFVPDGDYAGFIREYTGKLYPEGDFIGTNGEIFGRHKGIIQYTVGQRKGLGLSFPQPMYVVEKNIARNTVTLGVEQELYKLRLSARDFNWISLEKPPESPIKVTAKTRYSAKEAAAYAWDEDGVVRVQFEEPQRAVCPGQAVVLYDGDTVVGGGTIVG